MAEVKMPHPQHDKHLCYLSNIEYQKNNPDEYKGLVKNAQFFCGNCGRAAASEKNLCKPIKI